MSVELDILRQKLRRRRLQLGVGAQLMAAVRLGRLLRQHPTYRQSRHIAFYLATKGELSCHLAMKMAIGHGKQCFLPVLDCHNPDYPMVFARYLPGCRLVKNRFRILEPISTDRLPAMALDMVLMPLVGFDRSGNRIGMGGGYYDRTFSALRNASVPGRPKSRNNPLLVGVAHRCQQVPRLQPQPWDIPMDTVIAV